jgi:hypothetical protein
MATTMMRQSDLFVVSSMNCNNTIWLWSMDFLIPMLNYIYCAVDL